MLIKVPVKKKFFFDLFLCFLSSIFLSLAFPLYNLTFLAWFGLVPFFLAIDGKKARSAFFLGWFCGSLFFLGTMYWFFYLINWFGWIVLVGVFLLLIYLGLYWAVFALLYQYVQKDHVIRRAIVLSAGWVALEYARGHLLTGFDWAGLGYSQQQHLLMIQVVDVTGVFGLTFLIVIVNIYFKEVIKTIIDRNYRQEMQSSKALMNLGLIVLTFLMGTVGYGIYRMQHLPVATGHMKVAVVQGNVSQDQKWTQLLWPEILTKHMRLSEKVLAAKPDLIIWPETSFPGIAEEDAVLWDLLVQFVKKMQTPLLVGAIEKEGDRYYNSAFLFARNGELIEKYRKIHLVPFGEFFPLRSILSPIANMLDIGDFTKGDQFSLFRMKEKNARPFSVLICFEDTVNSLARRFTQAGSEFFINMTNDAWFGDTQASILHMQNSVFRAVENRRQLVRAANTGVSCFIDHKGEIKQGVEDKDRRATFVDGVKVGLVEFYQEKTFYTKYGDVFAYLCFGCILTTILRKEIKWRKKI